MECQCKSVCESPEHETPIGAVPKSTHEHGDEEKEVGVEFAFSVSAEWDIDIIAQPAAEGNMPFAPEYGDVGCGVGIVEVLFEAITQHEGNTYGNV